MKYLDKQDEAVKREREIETFKTQGESLERQWMRKLDYLETVVIKKLNVIQKFDYKSEGVSKKRAET